MLTSVRVSRQQLKFKTVSGVGLGTLYAKRTQALLRRLSNGTPKALDEEEGHARLGCDQHMQNTKAATRGRKCEGWLKIALAVLSLFSPYALTMSDIFHYFIVIIPSY